MSTPVVHESTALSDGDRAPGPEAGEWRRQLIGLLTGIVLAILVYIFFPAGAADTVAQSSGAKEGVEYSAQALSLIHI